MGKNKASLESRMRTYEAAAKSTLTRRVPVIIRLDGVAFHAFTRGMMKPFDHILRDTMQHTTKYLCENISGCIFGYTQSDEITLVLTDYATIKTDAWFNYSVQKLCSISASIATLAFNTFFAKTVQEKMDEYNESASAIQNNPDEWNYLTKLSQKFFRATFDARAFNVPKEDVCNCLIWRQQDAARNSIEMAAQSYFSHKQLHGKNCNELQDMLWKNHNVNWNDFPVEYRRGACCIKVETVQVRTPLHHPDDTTFVTRRRWKIDKEPPIFTKNRDYIERFL